MSQYLPARHVALGRASARARGVAAVATLMVLGACGDSDTALAPAIVRRDGPLASLGRTPGPDVIPGQYIVTFRRDVSDAPGLAKQLVAQHGGQIGFTYTAAIKGFSAKLPDQAVAALQRNPQVGAVESDLTVMQSGAVGAAQWGLDRIDQRSRPLDYSFTTTGGAGANIYIVDTGVRTTHALFGGRAVEAYTAISDGRGASDCGGHGTHVAGTAASSRYGVAPLASLYSVRVLDCNGSGTMSGLIAGMDWIAKNGKRPAVVNMSLAGSYSATLNSAVANGVAAGIVYVVAAGNSAIDACTVSPASTPSALTVGATASNDAVPSFSNYGKCVDLHAPGVVIRSTWYTSDTASYDLSGTSMASPHVAGVAALYLAAHPTASPAEVAQAIVGSATGGVLTSLGVGSPNLLVYSNVAPSGAPPPAPIDSSIVAPPPPSSDVAPVAGFTVNGCPKGKCGFDASGSTDDKGIVGYAWSYGDGTTASSAGSLQKTVHAYSSAGTYSVTLTITDTGGNKGSKTQSVSVKRVN